MPRSELSAASRDAYQALRRFERQQAIVERAYAAAQRLSLAELAREFGVAERTVARDVERLRLSGVPIETHRGRGGGVSLSRAPKISPVQFDLPEIAALLSSLASVGPSVSSSATSAMGKLAEALGAPTPV